MKLTIEQLINNADSDVLVSARDTSVVLTDLVWDSRLVQPGSLFVAFVGERVNGNDYIEEAIKAGAGAVVASQTPDESVCRIAREQGVALLQARNDDVLGVLLKLARMGRDGFKGTVVGITGSSGKTTTKDLVAGVLSAGVNTYATYGNHNSEIGLAETILNVTADHEAIVCEMGMQALGEIDLLCKAASPHIGVVTNVGVAHCELLGTRENIARAKAELLENLPDHLGFAILPGDDPYTPSLCTFARLRERGVTIFTYGLGEQNDIRATHIEYDDMGYPSFDIWTPDGQCYKARLSLQGEHNVLNALAAVAVGMRIGVPMPSIIEALAMAKPAALRQEVIETEDGCVILNDTYNANPDSMRAALSLLKRLATGGKHIAVLGDMYELGSEEVRFHRQIGEYAFVNGVDELVTVGELGKEIAAGALAVGMPAERVHICAGVAEALDVLGRIRCRQDGRPLSGGAAGSIADSSLAEGSSSSCDGCDALAEGNTCVILVKASRGMQLERITMGLIAQSEATSLADSSSQAGAFAESAALLQAVGKEE